MMTMMTDVKRHKRTRRQQGVYYNSVCPPALVQSVSGGDGISVFLRLFSNSPPISGSTSRRNGRIYAITPGTVPNGHVRAPFRAPRPTTTPPHPPRLPLSDTSSTASSLRVLHPLVLITIKIHTGATGRRSRSSSAAPPTIVVLARCRTRKHPRRRCHHRCGISLARLSASLLDLWDRRNKLA